MRREYGQPFSFLTLQGRIVSNYNHSPFIQALLGSENLMNHPDCKVIHEGRNRLGSLLLPRADGAQVEIVIKEFRTQGVDKLKSILLPGRAWKAWSGAHALVERGIGTPFPVAYLEKRGHFALSRSYYLCEKVYECEEIRSLFVNLEQEELKSLIRSLASYLFFCHEKGILHHDLSDGNILVRIDKERKYDFFLIDTNRVRVKNQISPLSRIKNLIRLGVPPKLQGFFLTHYLGKPNTRRALWLWYRFNKKSYTLYVELKKKLRLRQLVRRLKIQ